MSLFKQFKCPQCRKWFRTEKGVKLHQARKHKDTTQDPVKTISFNEYRCEFCDIDFNSKDEKLAHISTHKFSCPRCTFNVLSKTHLDEHLLRDHFEEYAELEGEEPLIVAIMKFINMHGFMPSIHDKTLSHSIDHEEDWLELVENALEKYATLDTAYRMQKLTILRENFKEFQFIYTQKE